MLTQLVIGVAGLIASVTAAVLAFLNFRRQGRSRIAEFRREWIEELRADIAIVLSTALSQLEKMEISELKRMQEAHFRIELRLNEAEKNHRELLEMLRVVIGLHSEGEHEIRIKVLAKAQEQARQILRDEWLRLKSEIQNWR